MEISQFGWNLLTIGFLGTFIFALVEGWGLWKQKRTLWANPEQHGGALSIPWITLFFVASCGYVVHGIYRWEIAVIWSGGLAAILHIPILLGLWLFKGFDRRDAVLLYLFLVGLIAMIFLPAREDLFFLIFSGGTVPALIMQLIEIVQRRNSSIVEIRLLFAYLGSTLFWVIYGFAAHDAVLRIVAPGQFTMLLATVLVWFMYRKPALAAI